MIVEIYLIRHGIAAERGTYADDEQRPLTDRGISKTTKVAKSLVKKVNFELILTSPLIRAYQTAEILKQEGLSQTVQTFLPLKPDGNIEEWFEWLQVDANKQKYHSLALVGHQPDLGNWAEILIWGKVKGQIALKKAGIIGITIPEIEPPISNSILFLLSAPKWIV